MDRGGPLHFAQPADTRGSAPQKLIFYLQANLFVTKDPAEVLGFNSFSSSNTTVIMSIRAGKMVLLPGSTRRYLVFFLPIFQLKQSILGLLNQSGPSWEQRSCASYTFQALIVNLFCKSRSELQRYKSDAVVSPLIISLERDFFVDKAMVF